MESSAATTALIGVLVSAATGGSALLIDFFKLRSPMLGFDHAREQFRDSTEFLSNWVSTYQAVIALVPGNGRELAVKYAETILTHAQQVLDRTQAERLTSTVPAPRIFALLKLFRVCTPKNGLTWIPQLLYYASMGIAFRVAWTLGFSLATIICGALVLLFWAACWGLERRAHRD